MRAVDEAVGATSSACTASERIVPANGCSWQREGCRHRSRGEEEDGWVKRGRSGRGCPMQP
eukprot:scaffold15002_cov31-Tisochrysis_lutea.AAC.1